jgi:hypothetical protein
VTKVPGAGLVSGRKPYFFDWKTLPFENHTTPAWKKRAARNMHAKNTKEDAGTK